MTLFDYCTNEDCPIMIKYTETNISDIYWRPDQNTIFNTIKTQDSIKNIIRYINNAFMDKITEESFLYDSFAYTNSNNLYPKKKMNSEEYNYFVKVVNDYIPLECGFCSEFKKKNIFEEYKKLKVENTVKVLSE